MPGKPEPAPRLLFDWIALALIVAGRAFGGAYATRELPGLLAQTQASTARESPALPAAPETKTPLTPPSSAAEPQREVVCVQRPAVNVRADASAEAVVVGTLKQGTKLFVFQRRGVWLQVGEAMPMGWVHQSLLGASPPN